MRRDAGLPQRFGDGRVQRGRRQQRCAEAQARGNLAQVALRQAVGELARQAQAVGMDAAGGQEHDGMAGLQLLAQAQTALGADDARTGRGQVDAAVTWEPALSQYKLMRKKYLLYP